MRRTRLTTVAAATTAALVALTACSSGADAGGSGGDGDVTLRFTWWGSDHRHEATQEIVSAFEDEHPDISIDAEYGDWSGYWDQLATQVAAGDAPDIMQFDEMYLREYADRGALLDLADVDLSEFDESVAQAGQVDGAQYGVTTGTNAFVMMANPRVFEEAGVEIPDDTSWTWDDFREITSTIGEETDYAGVARSSEPQLMQNFLRQRGKHLTEEDGSLGLETSDIEDYLVFLDELLEGGSFPDAETLVEDGAAGQDQSLTGTGEAGIGLYWTNQLPGLSSSSGDELVPLRFPSESGDPADNGLWLKSSMLMSASADTEHPEAAQKFIDWFVNSETAGQENLIDRGLPANASVRETVLGEIEGQDLASSEFLVDVQDEITESEPIPPAGFSSFGDAVFRYEEEVFFGRMDPAEAAAQMMAELEQSLQ